MRVHPDGYIQAKQMTVWISADAYRRANVSAYRSEGMAREIGRELNIEISGQLTFRIIQFRNQDTEVCIQIDSNWIQPTRA